MLLKDELRKIVELQEIDLSIYNLSRQKDSELPRQLNGLKEAFEKKKQELSAFEEKTKELQVKKKNVELELASKEESLRKSQGQLYQLKTNKEYQAKLTEIESLKADVSVAEENVLKALEEIELLKKDSSGQKELLAKEEKSFKDKESAVLSQVKEAEGRISQLQSKRDSLAKDVDKKILSKYEELLKKRDGLAIVPVKGLNCGACHLTVTHQKINEIKMYDKLVLCNSCVRILYAPEDIT